MTPEAALPDPMRGDKGDVAREEAERARGGATPEESTPGSEDTDVNVTTPGGGVGIKARLHPGSAQYRIVVLLFGVGSACGWLVATGWVFGRAIVLPTSIAVWISLLPALVLLAGGGYLALHGAKREAHRLHDSTFAKTPKPPRSFKGLGGWKLVRATQGEADAGTQGIDEGKSDKG